MSVVLFPRWFFWNHEQLPAEFAWVRKAWMSTIVLTLLCIFEAVIVVFIAPINLRIALMSAGLLWLLFGAYFLLRSLIHSVADGYAELNQKT